LHQFSYNEIVSSRALLPPPKSPFKPSIMQFPDNLTASEIIFSLEIRKNQCNFSVKKKRKTQYFKGTAAIQTFPKD